MNPVKQRQRKGAFKLMSDASIHAMDGKRARARVGGRAWPGRLY